MIPHGASRTFLRLLTAALVLLPAQATTSAATPPIGSRASSTVTNVDLLALLEVRPEVTSPAYERSFFRHWVDADSDCQDTRVEVLAREDRSGTRHGCRAVTGAWSSWLDGRTFTSSRSLDVDHLVALKEAWGSGAYAWSPSRREAYANDLGYEWSLRAVSASSNRSKSDRDPAEWLPMRAVHCEYVSRWMMVKYRWTLSVDQRERTAILKVLDTGCGSRVVALPFRVDGSGREDAPTSPPVTIPSNTSLPAPVRPPATTVPPVGAPVGTVVAYPVHPGAFCSPAGATGMSVKGVAYVCRSSATDARNRWRRS